MVPILILYRKKIRETKPALYNNKIVTLILANLTDFQSIFPILKTNWQIKIASVYDFFF